MELQRANGWKRIAAWILDIMLLCVLAVGAAWGVSAIIDYDSHYDTYVAALEKYEAQYGVDFDIDQKTYEALTPAEKTKYDTAHEALNSDEEALRAYSILTTSPLMIVTSGILAATLILEFIVPLIFKNGQTLGKKCFSLAVVRIDSVQINPLQLFARTLLGKFTIGRMVPLYLLMMSFSGALGIVGLAVIVMVLILQIACIAIGPNRAAIHDRLAGTVVVDFVSQKIFETTEERIAYANLLHEEQVKRQDY